MEESLFAYSMSQAEQGWIWRLWNEIGEVVAAGDAPDQLSAQRDVLEAFERTQTAALAQQQEARHEQLLDPRGRASTRGRLAGGAPHPGATAARAQAVGSCSRRAP